MLHVDMNGEVVEAAPILRREGHPVHRLGEGIEELLCGRVHFCRPV